MSVFTLHTDKPVTAANLVWEEPPTLEKKSGKYGAFAKALHENPGRWAVLTTFTAASKKRGWARAHSINTGRLVDFPRSDSGRFEAVCRTTNDEARVYVRFIDATVTQAVAA